MKKIVKRSISMLLCLAMVIGFLPATMLTASAASTVGDRVDTSVTGGSRVEGSSFNANDYIALPIEIYDYKADGMLFEYAEKRINTNYYTWTPPTATYGFDFRTNKIDTTSTGWYSAGYNLNRGWNASYKYDIDNYSNSKYLRATKNGTLYNNTGLYDDQVLSVGPFTTAAKNTDVRYMAICYRASSNCDDTFTVQFRGNSNSEPFTVQQYSIASTKGNGWTTAVIDLKNTQYSGYQSSWGKFASAGSIKYIGFRPADNTKGATFDIAYVAFFDTEAKAKSHNTNSFEKWTMNNNAAFGLVGSSYDADGTNDFKRISLSYGDGSVTAHNTGSWFADSGNAYTPQGTKYTNYKTSIWQIGPHPTNGGKRDNEPSNIENYIGYKLIADWSSSPTSYTAGLMQPQLVQVGNNFLPQYKEETVWYIANLLKHTLSKAQKSGTNYDYSYVMGEYFDYDGDGDTERLAAELRTLLSGAGVGTWNETIAKANDGKLHGSWVDCKANITTYMDAAFYLLNNLFIKNSYNVADTTYDHLLLSRASVKLDGKYTDCYVFDSGFATSNTATSVAINYNPTTHTIQNTSAAHKPYSYYDTSNHYTATFPFTPLSSSSYTSATTSTPYFMDDGVREPASAFNTYKNRNYNYVLRTHGEFIYREDKNLFFEFEGDDDIYLYINGQLVMEMGGAHPCATQSIKLNDYVNDSKSKSNPTERDYALMLEDGESYSFDFFFMERKGYGSNMRIITNIEVVDTDMDVVKNAYQDGYKLPENGAIDLNRPVEFSFTLINEGNKSSTDNSYLQNLVFSDPKIGVNISYNNGLSVTNSRIVNANGDPLTWKDLVFSRCNTSGGKSNDYSYANGSFKTEADLKAFLAMPETTGLLREQTLEIRGIYIMMTQDDFAGGPWSNTVTVDAITSNNTALRTTDELRLNSALAPVYYMWADHKLTIADMLGDINEAIAENKMGEIFAENLTLKSIGTITLVNTSGVPVENENVVVENNVITANYKVPGTYLVHFKINYTYNNAEEDTGVAILPIHIYVFDVEDEVFVLDYGLKVDLSEGGRLTDQDTLKVPGQSTGYLLEDIVNNSPIYVTGAVGNHLSFNSGTDVFDGVYSFDLANTENGVWTLNIESDTKDLVAEQVSALDSGNLFKVRAVEDGYYTIQSCLTGKYLTVGSIPANEYSQARNYIAQSEYTGADNQLWKFTLNNGYYNITPKASRAINGESQYLYCAGNSAVLVIGNSGNNTDNPLTYDSGKWRWAINKQSPSSGSGQFTLDKSAQKLVYSPSDFMKNAETTYLAVRVHESGFTPSAMGVTDINREVEMFKAVTVIPANVVYYEDDFPAIRYYNATGEEFENKISTDGSSGNLWQSNDPDENYGRDKVYEEGGVPVSGASVTTVTIDKKTTTQSKVAEFTFAGTGFELISRTTATDSATIIVKVLNAEGKTVKSVPVITEFDNDVENSEKPHTEAIYQVPVVRVEGLDFGTYTVQICGVASLLRDENGKAIAGQYKTTYLYVDGIRIYNPLGGGNVAHLKDQYNESEQNVTFAEIRDLIMKCQLAVAEFFTDSWTVGTGLNTYTENRVNAGYDGNSGWTKEYKGNVVTDINDYLAFGPNNEVYLNGISSNQSIVLYVKQTDNNTPGTLQIGMHLINEKAFFGLDGEATRGVINLGIKNGENLAWQSFHADLASGTELYYNIEYTKCPVDSNGYYQVVLFVEDGMVSFTNLKYAGLTIRTMSGTAPEIRFENGKLVMPPVSSEPEEQINTADYVDFPLLAAQLRSTEVVQPQPPEPPATEPEATEPEATEPEATEPEATEPKPTEPKPTEPKPTECAHKYDDNVDGTCNICGIKRENVEKRQVVHMLRMYNPNTGEHFYTGSTVERDDLIAEGWQYEGIAFTFPANTGAPVYRLFQPSTGEHLYTMNKAEKEKLEAAGWNYEGVAFNSAYNTEAVQHRLHNPNATIGAYHFTFSEEEKQNLINAGWEYQGIGWYSCWK